MSRRNGELSPTELEDFVRVEPPAFLDGLVRARVNQVLERQRWENAAADSRGTPRSEAPAGAGAGPTPTAMGRAEAWAYAFGFLAYGAQLADGVARNIWRALLG